jgi:probable rRNA maturation factor
VHLPAKVLAQLHVAAEDAWRVLDAVKLPVNSLDELDILDIALVDREESDRVHREFMDIAGATDVITFHHGELLICPDIARMQALDYDEPVWRELLRYMVHGMLHLAGYQDAEVEDRLCMEAVQERMVAQLWSCHFGKEFEGK